MDFCPSSIAFPELSFVIWISDDVIKSWFFVVFINKNLLNFSQTFIQLNILFP